jgi:hypothetical protein
MTLDRHVVSGVAMATAAGPLGDAKSPRGPVELGHCRPATPRLRVGPTTRVTTVQEGQRDDKNVRLDAFRPAGVDRPQFDDVLESAEGALDLGQLLAGLDDARHGVLREWDRVQGGHGRC